MKRYLARDGGGPPRANYLEEDLYMRIRDALNSLQRENEKDVLSRLYTTWGEQLDKDNVWQEYPRPQMRREGYHMLNGVWEYAIVSAKEEKIVVGTAFEKDGDILVPFSPESILSGVERQLKPDEFLWYQREVVFGKRQGHCLLHFDAVDQEATVYINGEEVAYHMGGYLPFVVDVTSYVGEESILLQVKVKDVSDTSYHSRGKQKLKRGGMFYTAQSGIWQSVWYEWVPERYVSSYRITPYYDDAKVQIAIQAEYEFEQLSCQVKNASCEVSRNGNTLEIIFADGDFQPWTPETPYLYDFILEADEDRAEGYFAMRCFSLEKDERGHTRACLNHKPYFQHGILDQGYWSDGLMTAPCDEAFIYDIELVKNAGFNMIRKHIKIEPLRWYYHCDRLGVLVWQDMVNGGTDYNMLWTCYFPTVFPGIANRITDNHYALQSRKSIEGREEWEMECMETIKHLYNVPSIGVWVPFNEGWGQFDAERITRQMQAIDPTRLIDHASGWFDQKAGDFRSVHNYFRKLKTERTELRAFVISEYGGFACHLPEHSSIDKSFGYKVFHNVEDLSKAIRKCLEEDLLPLEEKGLSGAVYTQVSDIEEEVNGLVTYDRKIVKYKK